MSKAKDRRVTVVVETIDLSLITGAGYQRRFNKRKAQEIADDFHPEECGVLVVTDQGDGTYTGTEGQHRLWALRFLGYTEWPCQVLAPRALSDEARVFVDVNTKRTALVGADRWRARRMAHDPAVLEIESLVRGLGLVIDQDAHRNWRVIRATSALERVYRTAGPSHLEEVLRIIGNAWPEDELAFKADVILGVASFLVYYRDAKDFKRSDLVDKLAAVPLVTMLQRASVLGSGKANSASGEFSFAPGMVRAIVNAYNYKRRTHILEEPTLKGWHMVRASMKAKP